jgi:tricorn protease
MTDHPRTERDPMWIGDRIYFASDRDGTLNLYYLDLTTRETHQVTHSTDFDVRWPSRDEAGQIVYEKGGELYVLDTQSGESRKVSIHVPTDGLAMRPRRVPVANQISGIGLSPGGSRLVVAARGDIFSRSGRERTHAESDTHLRANMTSGPAGRRTDRRSSSFPTGPARKNCT